MIPGSTGYKEAVALTEKEIDSSEVVVRSEGSFDSCCLGERKTSWLPDRVCRARRWLDGTGACLSRSRWLFEEMDLRAMSQSQTRDCGDWVCRVCLGETGRRECWRKTAARDTVGRRHSSISGARVWELVNGGWCMSAERTPVGIHCHTQPTEWAPEALVETHSLLETGGGIRRSSLQLNVHQA